MGKEIQYRLKLITNKKKLILGVTIVYDFLATSRNRLRAGPNAKTKDDRTDKLIYKSFRIKVGATFKCFKYIFMKSENITLRQSFISTT